MRPNKRAQIIAGAYSVVYRGLPFTLENVAKEAGVSRGGIIYHFSTLTDLIRALIDHAALRNGSQHSRNPRKRGSRLPSS
jgi:AcrR family transcriptional regulator